MPSCRLLEFVGGGAAVFVGGFFFPPAMKILGQSPDLGVTRITFSVLDSQDGVIGDSGISGDLGQITN